MTWDQLMGKIREGLTESGARIKVLGKALPEMTGNGVVLNTTEVLTLLMMLTLAVSDLHSVIEHLAIGLDAVVGVYREADKSQEV